MGKGIFITGTDTGVGKTLVTACLASLLLKKGKKVAVYKPVQCGNLLRGRVKSPDLALVRNLSKIPESSLFNDYCFKFASSPHLAAELEEIKVNNKLIKAHFKDLCEKFEYVLVEGAGGLLVPLTKSYTVLDLIKDLKVHVVVVARAGLGTINHTSMTLRLLRDNKIKVKGVIINNFKGGKIEEDNKKIISSLNKVKISGVVPYSKNIKQIARDSKKYIVI